MDSVTTIERLGSYWSVAEGGEKYQALSRCRCLGKGLSGTASMSMGMDLGDLGAALQWLWQLPWYSTENVAALGDSRH